MKEQIQLIDINPQPAANAAGTTVLTLPGGRIHGIEVIGTVAAAKMAAGFRDARFMVGGNQQRVSTLTQLSDALSLYGAEYAVQGDLNGGPFRLLYPFTENWRKQYLAAERFAFDNPTDAAGVPLRSAQLEIDFLNTAAAKTLAFRAIVEPLNSVTDKTLHNAFTKHFRKPYGIQSDTLHILDLPKKDIYQLIELYDPTGNEGSISRVKVKINGRYVFDRTKAEQDQDLKRWGMKPRDDVFSIVPDITDNTQDGWNMQGVEEFILEVTTDVASTGNVNVISHRFGLPE